jgi:hypothetical protein
MINPSKNKIPGESPKEDFFGKKGYLSRPELREKLRKAPSKVSGLGKWYTRRERVSMEKETFGREYKDYITRQECRDRLRKLGREKFEAKTGKEKLDINRRLKYLKELTGL